MSCERLLAKWSSNHLKFRRHVWALSAAPAQPRLSTSPKCTRSNSPCRALPPHSHTLPSPCPIPTIPSRFWHCKVTQLLWSQRWISAMQARGTLKSITKLRNHPPLQLLHLNPSPAGSAVFSTRMCQWPSPHHIIWGWWGVPLAWRSAQNMLYLLLRPACPWATLGMSKTSP